MAEPEWDEATRELVLGLDAVDLCPSCGGPSYLCQDAAREFDWKVSKPVRCHRSTALKQAQRRISEETNPIPEALLWQAVLSDRSVNG
jgi:hypothetical protein